MNIKNNKRAFTLVEMIIVIAVIAVLAAMLVLVLPSVIDKAKHASATSDARNTATAYEKYNVDAGKEDAEEAVIIVKKSKEYYVYGYNHGKLNESASNVYEAESAEVLFTRLINNSSVKNVGDVQENVTEKLDKAYKNVTVYEGYRLTDLVSDISIESEEELLYIGVEEKYALSPKFPDNCDVDDSLVEWKCSNTNATVKNGVVCGASAGDVVITLTYGNKSASLNARIIDYIDFSGNLPEMKALIENTDIPLVMLNLTGSVQYVGDTSFLPITINEGIRVRIKPSSLSDGIFVYADELKDSLIYNNGGSLWIGGNDSSENWIKLTDRRAGVGSIETSASAIINENGGKIELENRLLEISFGMQSGSTIKNTAAIINNINGTVILNNCSSHISTGNGVTVNSDAPIIYNDKNGVITLSHSFKADCPKGTCVENHGKINTSLDKSQENGMMYPSSCKGKTAFLNYGTIGILNGFAFTIDPDGVCIDSVGNKAQIEGMKNCTLNYDSYPVREGEVPEYCLRFTGGASIGYISSGHYSYSNAMIFADKKSDKTLEGVVSGGEFATYIDEKYIASGRFCYTRTVASQTFYEVA